MKSKYDIDTDVFINNNKCLIIIVGRFINEIFDILGVNNITNIHEFNF